MSYSEVGSHCSQTSVHFFWELQEPVQMELSNSLQYPWKVLGPISGHGPHTGRQVPYVPIARSHFLVAVLLGRTPGLLDLQKGASVPSPRALERHCICHPRTPATSPNCPLTIPPAPPDLSFAIQRFMELHCAGLPEVAVGPPLRQLTSRTLRCWGPSIRLLEFWGACLEVLFRSWFGLVGLCLWGVLLRHMPGRRTPLGWFLLLPTKGHLTGPVLALGYIGSATARYDIVDKPCLRTNTRGRRVLTHGQRIAGGLSRALIWAIGFSCLPLQVWAAPPGLSDTLAMAHNVAGDAPANPQQGEAEPLQVTQDHGVHPAAAGHEPARSADAAFARPEDQLVSWPRQQSGQGLPVAEDTWQVDFISYVVSPSFLPETLHFQLQLPCEEPDAARATQRELRRLNLAYEDVVVPATPQPDGDFQTFLVHPSWSTFAGLAAIVLDLRLCPLNKTGPLTAAFVTRPTNLTELKREAGIFSIRRCRVYVCDQTVPLSEHEQVFLESGMLVRFVPEDTSPTVPERLHSRLQDPDRWQPTLTGPPIPGAGTVMLLHNTGRFLFSRAQATDGPMDNAAADFIGVPRYTISMLSPSGDAGDFFTYRGTSIRGIIACVNNEELRDGGQVLFLDLRQIASSFQFTVLQRDFITYDDLLGLLPRAPPRGWRPAFHGGVKHHTYVRVRPGDTITFGFVRCEQEDDSTLSDSEPSEDGHSNDGEEEDGEEEEGLSETSTRSRSRNRDGAPSAPSPSPDPSYEADTQHCQHHIWQLPKFFAAWEIPSVVLGTVSCGIQWPLFEDLSGLIEASECASISYTGSLLEAKVPRITQGTSPVLSEEEAQVRTPALDPAEWRLGMNGLEPPELRARRPHHGFVVPAHQPIIQANFLLFAFEYAPEIIAVQLTAPSTVHGALAAVQAGRREQDRRRFPIITPVTPQPYLEFALAVATQAWCQDVYVCFDLGRLNGTIFSAHTPAVVDYASLLAIADLPPNIGVEIYVHLQPQALRPGDIVQLRTGYCITVVPLQQPIFVVTTLSDMLQSAQGWSQQVHMPAAGGRWIHILTDTEPCRFRLNPERRLALRQDIADMIAADAQRLTVRPTVQRISDHFDTGVLAHSVVVATEVLERTSREARTIYVLDLRPISCGLTWGLAEGGLVRAQPIADRCDSFSPPGYRAQITGGAAEHTDDGLFFRVADGGVLCVEFVEQMVLSSETEATDTEDSTDSDASTEDWSTSSGPDTQDNDESADVRHPVEGPGPAQPSGAGTDVSFRHHSAAKLYHDSQDVVAESRVAMWERWFHAIAVLTGAVAATPFLLPPFIVLSWALPDIHVATASVLFCPAVLHLIVFVACFQATGAVYTVPRVQANLGPLHVAWPGQHRGDSKQRYRPLPTPCRSAQPISRCPCASAPTAEPLLTLLEESVVNSHGHPFFLAATLLDVLEDHFRSAAAETMGPVPVSLEAHIPPLREFDLTPVSVNLGKGVDDIMPFLHATWQLPNELPPNLQLHAATRLAFETTTQSPAEGASSLRIFTDGAFDGKVSSWAFAVIALTPSGTVLKGWTRGRVALPGHPHHIGAVEHSALEGEKSALFWATAWLLQLHTELAEGVWSDCLVAIGQTSGTHNGAETSLSARACRGLAQAAEAICRVNSAGYRHVKGHSGDAFNELVDVLAKRHDAPDEVIPWPFHCLPDWVADGSIEWIWLLIEAFRRPGLWPTLQGSHIVDQDRHRQACPEPTRNLLNLADHAARPVACAKENPPTWAVQLRIVTVNVQTLEEDQQGGILGRVPFVRQQLEAAEATVVAIQETRAKSTETFSSATHYRFLSAGDGRGNLGVEIWFARSVPFAWHNNCPIYFERDDFQVLSWSPRHLVIRVARGPLKFLVATCHAPTATDPHRLEWWHQFAQLTIGLNRGDPVLLLGDFNVRFSEPWQGRIGDLCWERGTPTPDPLFRILSVLDLWVPATFEACHTGGSHTWVSPGHGAMSRIDHICVPWEWTCGPHSSKVLYDVDFPDPISDPICRYAFCVSNVETLPSF